MTSWFTRAFEMASAEMTSPAPPAKRAHLLVSLALLGLIMLTIAAVDVAAHSTRVAESLDTWQENTSRAHDRPFVRTRNYGSFFETQMLDEFPNADYSRGGAYVVGSSIALYCADFHDLAANERRLIHSYGFPLASVAEISQLLHYLIEHEGLLSAGPEKTQLILAFAQDD